MQSDESKHGTDSPKMREDPALTSILENIPEENALSCNTQKTEDSQRRMKIRSKILCKRKIYRPKLSSDSTLTIPTPQSDPSTLIGPIFSEVDLLPLSTDSGHNEPLPPEARHYAIEVKDNKGMKPSNPSRPANKKKKLGETNICVAICNFFCMILCCPLCWPFWLCVWCFREEEKARKFQAAAPAVEDYEGEEGCLELSFYCCAVCTNLTSNCMELCCLDTNDRQA